MSGTILIVDDDPVQRRLLDAMVRRAGFDAVSADTGEAAMAAVAGPDGGRIDVVVLDLGLPDLDGFGVLARMREAEIQTPVIVQTANGSIDAVVSAMRAGATDFVVKPVGAERLQVSIGNALKARALEGELRRITRRQTGTLTFDDLASRAEAMAHAVALGRRAAGSSIPVMIEGETGVGKELFARAIAASGERAGRPFVAVNCGAIPENLVESTLFGHEKGAFTGATERHTGKFVEAHGGTLFLDEVGELPLAAQVKLLRALQEGEVDPVGGRKPVKVDIRVISATNRSLIDLVREERFREDLYYRLGVFPVAVPPLRQRREDIAPLARRFLARFAAEEGRRVRAIAPAAIAMLEAYDWPGNVRQLENTVFRALVLAESDELTAADFPQIAAALRHAPAPEPRPEAATPLPGAAAPVVPAVPFGGLRLLGEDGHVKPMEAVEREVIAHALDRYGGQLTEVARRLGIGRSTLYRKLKELSPDADCDPSDTSPPEAAAG